MRRVAVPTLLLLALASAGCQTSIQVRDPLPESTEEDSRYEAWAERTRSFDGVIQRSCMISAYPYLEGVYVRGLQEGDLPLRVTAASELALIWERWPPDGPRLERCLPSLVELLRHRSGSVHTHAMYARSFAGPRALPIFLAMLESEDALQQRTGVAALGAYFEHWRAGGEALPVVAALRERIRARGTRASEIHTLQMIVDKATVDPLRAAAEDAIKWGRDLRVEGVDLPEDPLRRVEALEATMLSAPYDEKFAPIYELKDLGEPGQEALRRAVLCGRLPPEVRGLASKALAVRFPDLPPTIPTLMWGLRHSDPLLREEMSVALGWLVPTDRVPRRTGKSVLSRLRTSSTRDPEWPVRDAARIASSRWSEFAD